MSQPLIAMQNLSKQYHPSPNVVTDALAGVDFAIEPGELVAIMGPSGSGKSTLMNILGTLDRPSSGAYCIDGEDVGRMRDAALANVRNRTIGFVFQSFNLLTRRTVLDNIALPLFYAGMMREERLARARELLAQVGLSTHADYLPTQLSGGQQQRVSIARALACRPKLLLADEPTGSLDSVTSREIMQLLVDLNMQGITVILVTHDHDVARYAKRLLQIKDGKLIYDGPMY